MPDFRIAFTGDFLDESGAVAYGDIGLDRLAISASMRWNFIDDLSPKRGDPGYWARLYSLEVAADHIEGVDGLVVLRPWVKRSTFSEGAADLVVIGRSGAGYDKIDLEACTEHGVAVFNAPMALSHSTASSALLFMLALAKRLPDQERITRRGRWDQQAAVMGSEIEGRTLGIVGLGHSGRELARLVAPFSMRLLAFSPHADPAAAQALNVCLTSLEEVMLESDFVSLHCRLNALTHGLIGAAQIALMKPGAYFINVGRGELVDQQALAAALRDRLIAGAGLDVFEVEPLPLDDPLLGLDNVILTPHWSASTSDVWRATGAAMAEGMLKAACGERPDNVVNPDVFEQVAFRKKLSRFNARAFLLFFALLSLSVWPGAQRVVAGDISALDQHFNHPDKDISPWIFVPSENIKEFSTEEHPGLATIYEAGKGSDIKGILKHPIKISDYRLPWEFQTSLVQSFNLMAGVGAGTQVNAAIGLNVAVTFSDPSTWPRDRTKRPPRTHEFQLLVVHLGCTGEAGAGLPQYSSEPHPETYLVWGRGDLGHTVMGDWRIPYVWIGDGAKYGGPASPQLFFRCVLQSPTRLAVGIKFDASHGWNMRSIDCSEFGPITGVWEIGPIISADRWIPDVLCRSLPQVKGPHPIMLGAGNAASHIQTMTPVSAPKPEPPNPKYEYYVDYCVFFGSEPRPFEKYSDEFDIVGYLGKWQVQEQCTLMDTHSHPGHLMLKLLGPGLGTGFGAAGGSALKLSDYPPPWEIETSFIAPDDSIPWNYWMNFIIIDKQGRNVGMWTPGVENDAKAKRHRPFSGATFQLRFDPEVPESILAHKPLAILIQCIDNTHVRLGFRAKPTDSWHLSEVYDTKKALGVELGAFGMHCWSTTTGRMYGAGPGGPMYQKFLVDYLRYRYGLSAPVAENGTERLSTRPLH